MRTDPRATEILLNALVSMGLLEKTGDRFTNVKGLADLLLPGTPPYLGGFRYPIRLWEAWSHLTETVKSGRPFISDRITEVERDFSLHMAQYAKVEAEALLRRLDFSDAQLLLDLGGGTGTYAIAIARQYPQMKAVLFDGDERALKIAQQDVIKHGLQDRVTLRRGDLVSDDIGEGYDLILLSSILCLFEEEQDLSLLRRVNKSLVSGGRVVIRDAIVDESRTRPATAAIFSVKMLVTSRSGRSYSHQEIEIWLRSTGFKDLRRIPMRGSQVIVGRKL